jgi:hypothetical protein
MEPDDSLSCSQEPSTGPYPEPDQSSPYHPILFPLDRIMNKLNPVYTIIHTISTALIMVLFSASMRKTLDSYRQDCQNPVTASRFFNSRIMRWHSKKISLFDYFDKHKTCGGEKYADPNTRVSVYPRFLFETFSL